MSSSIRYMGDGRDIEMASNTREKKQGPPKSQSIAWKSRIRHTTWNWFASTMSTGSLALVLGLAPFQFTGLVTIGKIVFIIDLIMFTTLCGLIGTRFVLHPEGFSRSLHQPAEALFFGSFWVSIALILSCAQIYGVPSCGPWLVQALRVCYWLYLTIALLVAIFQYSTLFVKEHLRIPSAMPAWIMPMYPLLVVGPLASLLVPDQPHDEAISMLVSGIMFQGVGWTVTIFTYTIYLLRLMANDLPAAPGRPAMFIAVGPAGYTSAALVSLGVQAQRILPGDWMGETSIPAGDILRVLGIVSGMFLWLVSFWFFALACCAVIQGIKEMTFTLAWWAFIFPNGGMTLAAIQIGNAIQSDSIKGVASGLTILMVLAWLFAATSCARAVWRKKIMWPGEDEDHDASV